MTWNYRATLTRTEHGPVYEIREIYYDNETGGLSWTADPVAPSGETGPELFSDVERMATDARSNQVLDITDPDNPTWVEQTPQEPEADRG